MAHDSRRGVTVMFGGYGGSSSKRDTREWNGREWILRAESGPPPSSYAQMVFDSVRGVCVLVSESATWEWDGQSWQQRTAASFNRPRRDFGLAYDAARKRVVLFGGYENSNVSLRDTWTWNGQTWQQVATSGPPARREPAMTYDPVRKRVVLFGGQGSALMSDTWEWNGTSWTPEHADLTGGPTARTAARMTFSQTLGRVVLFGGQRSNTSDAGLWCWDGVKWSELPSKNAPGRAWHGLVEDHHRGVLVCFGGSDGVRTFGDTRELSMATGSDTWLLKDDATGPSRRRGASCAYDSQRGVVVLFGGNTNSTFFRDTWEWNGQRWRLCSPTGPVPPVEGTMCYDPDRGVTVLICRINYNSPWMEAWEWDGSEWSFRLQMAALTGRMVYDEARHVCLFFGCVYNGGTPSLPQTWTWDGQTWTLVASGGPSARLFPGMAWDTDRQVVVLHGGYDQTTAFSDTWEWNGVTWTERQHTSAFARYFHGLVYDTANHRMLGLGGFSFHQPFVGSGWVWDPNAGAWQMMAPGDGPGRLDFSLTYHETRQEIFRFGGTESYAFDIRDDTRILDFAAPPMIPVDTPRDFPAYSGSWAEFHVNVDNLTPPEYQWRRNGVPLKDGDDIAGSHTDQLIISNVDFDDEGAYDVVMSNDCGESLSNSATLTVRMAGDATGDKQVNMDDLVAVIAAWGPCPSSLIACPADLTPMFGDGMIDVSDLLAVINHWGD